MVEKVFISPNRVRAYGNIVNMKTGDDFTLVNSELTVTTDTVDGAEMTVFSMECEAHISVSATNPYLLSGETTDIVAKLKKCLYKPLTNKNVTIEQSIFRDDGTTVSHNDDWVKYNPDNITITRGEEYTSVTGSNYRYGVPISNNCKIRVETRKPTASSGPLLSIWGYSTNPLSASQLLTFSVTEMGMTQGTFANIEMVVTSSSVTVTNLDNNTTITKEYNTSNNLIFNFWGTTFDYKNFKIYETINGVTDERGEFALHDVNVTDDTTFTATYGTVSATCKVEYCSFVDYATTSNHNDSWDGLTYMSRGTDGTTINNTGSGTLFERIKINNSTYPFSNGDFTVTLNILSVTGSDNRLRVIGATTCSGDPYAQVDYTLLSTSIGEFKMVYDSTNHTVKIYKDGALLVTNNRALCGNLNFNFRIPAGNSIKYKDLRIRAL